MVSPEEWAGAPTQQGHTIADRLDDPALAAVSLFNYVDARDAAEFVDGLARRRRQSRTATTFFVGADDALAHAPLAELLPRFLPGSRRRRRRSRSRGDAPAFSRADAPQTCSAGAPRRRWRNELAAATPPPTRPPPNRAAHDPIAFDGVLFFPVTPFDAAGRVDLDVLRDARRVAARHALPAASSPPAAPASSTRFAVAEAAAVVRHDRRRRRHGAGPRSSPAPGGSLGTAMELARAAAGGGRRRAPPPAALPRPAAAGRAGRLRRGVAAASEPARRSSTTGARARYTPTRCAASRRTRRCRLQGRRRRRRPAQDIVLAVRAEPGAATSPFFNGLLTAELTQAAYRGLGIPLYSSAAFAMVPELATLHYRAYSEATRRPRLASARRSSTARWCACATRPRGSASR